MTKVISVRLTDEQMKKLNYITLHYKAKFLDEDLDIMSDRITPGTVAQAMLIATIEKIYNE